MGAAIEKGLAATSMIERIREFDKEKEEIECQRQELVNAKGPAFGECQLAEDDSTFFREFSSRFDEVALIERKGLIRTMVEGILVHPVKKVVCYIRWVPRVESVKKIEENQKSLVSVCSPKRNPMHREQLFLESVLILK